MKLKATLLLTFFCFFGPAAPTALSQQAIFAMPEGVVGLPYNQRVSDILRTNYRREIISEGGAIEWSSSRGLPAGLAIDADGTIYGTPQVARAFIFRIQAVDTAHLNNGPTSLTLALTILKHGQSTQTSGGPVLRPVDVRAPTQGISSTGVQVDVSGFEPSKSLALPLIVKSASGVQLEAIVFDNDGKPLRSAFTDQLPAGDVRTSLKVELEAGRNVVSIRDSATGSKYKTLTIDVPKIDVARNAARVEEAETPADIELKHEGTVAKDATTTKIIFHVGNPKIRKVHITVQSTQGGGGSVTTSTIPVEDKKQDYEALITLAAGDSKVTARDQDNDNAKRTSLIIKRKTSESEKFKVQYSQLVDKSSLTTPVTLMVLDADIAKIKVMITEQGKEDILYQRVLECAKVNEKCPLEIPLPERKNGTAYFIDVTKAEDPEAVGLVTFRSSTDAAKKIIDFEREGDSAVSTISLNSINTRAIVGFEQVGATASDSSSKPFLDFFFTAPLWFKREKDELPRLSLWGNIRLAALPSQVSTLGVLPTNFVSQVSDGKLSELIQGFDFNVGPELLLHSTKSFLSLIPGVKQRINVYFAGGFGAISPLNPKQRENVQIFTVPANNAPQYEEFKNRFPEAAASGKPYIALTFPERDRFLRQYYAGFRFKTHFSNGDGIINRFPAIFDLMIGRNEAVTGGKLEHAVVRMEGFYPLPIRKADFLYVYGTAMMNSVGAASKLPSPFSLTPPVALSAFQALICS